MDALIEAARSPDYPAEISLVLSNKSDALGLAKAKKLALQSLQSTTRFMVVEKNLNVRSK